MARIRTIKPEFPQSESMGKVSRESRLCFIMLWTLADDEGRLRGNSRMLASLLYPYDDDAPSLIDAWLGELEKVGCIVRYAADGASYVQIAKWLNHQKIDKPSKSKMPSPEDGSIIVAKAREDSPLDQGSRIKDLYQGEDQLPPKPPARIAKTETADETALKATASATWASYSAAYVNRYGVEPIRNATVNTQIKNFCKKVAHDEAPYIAEFYVSHNDAFYIRKAHDVGLMLTDASKLRTEWASGRAVTGHRARQEERSGSMLSIVDEIARERGER